MVYNKIVIKAMPYVNVFRAICIKVPVNFACTMKGMNFYAG